MSSEMGNAHDLVDRELDEGTRTILQRHGFDAGALRAARERLRGGEKPGATNRLRAKVTGPRSEDSLDLPTRGSEAHTRLHEEGLAAIRRGEVGTVVLAGGMATRFGGVVKAAVEVLDGRTFLDLKLDDIARTAERAGGVVPVFLMASFATDDALRSAIAGRARSSSPAEVFTQSISLRLAPDGELFRDHGGHVSLFAPGHGDLPSSLARAGILERFVAAGGRVLFMSNVDNLGASLDPALVALHLRGGAAITVEVAPKAPGDAGGIPARVDGTPQIVEAFRLPEGFDDATVDVFNTNTFYFDAAQLRPDVPLTWFLVQKTVEGRAAVQIERLVGEATAFLPTRFVRVERDGSLGRFFPVKAPEDLDLLRASLREALIARGALDGP